MAGVSVTSEFETNIGRIDVVAETDRFIYIMEFKLSDAATSLKQIRDRKYYEPYLLSDKKIILTGIAFDISEKNVSEYVFETLTTA